MPVRYSIAGKTSSAIVASIESGIRSGDLPVDTGLPAVRALAEDLGISPGTVAQAYKTLRQRGLVATDGRRGTRVRSKPTVVPRSQSRLSVPPGARDVSDGNPDPRLLPAFGPRLRGVAPEPVLYGRAGPIPELAAAARHRFHAAGLPASAIAVTSGCLDGLERVMSAHLSPGDVVAIEDPGWANLIDLLSARDLRITPMSVDEDGPTPDAVRAALAAGARAIVVTNRGQNPTGGVMSSGRARALRAILAKHQATLVIEDDHLGELASGSPHSLAGATKSWAFIRSLSKPYGPDLRCAVLGGDDETISRLEGRQWLETRW